MTAKPIFVGGTASHVGKSWVATALCRYLYRMGFRVAPFKGQNISNNSMACRDGGEIGRAQAAQAEACGIFPHPDMNPILLKPTGKLGSQVILNGRPWKNISAPEIGIHRKYLLEQVLAGYSRLADSYDFIVVEGAGSVAELNLKDLDLANLGLAERLSAPAILVADIDRGGVFGAVIGTLGLLSTAESSLIRSFVVNRFRGDPSLFREGVRILEEQTERPCLGVFPHASDIYLDDEDGVSIEKPQLVSEDASGVSVAILGLPHISNFTDFRRIPNPVYLSRPTDTEFDVVILPGTKSSIDDMAWLRASGLDQWVLDQVDHGSRVVGVCGGFQLMGQEIVDPFGVESVAGSSISGLGLLPVRTSLAQEKTTRTVAARTPSGIRFDAYEIHMGVTTVDDSGAVPFAVLEDGTSDGVRTDKAIGTYLHGALENQHVAEEILGCPVRDLVDQDKDANYDRLADWFVAHVDHDILMREYLADPL